MLKKLIIALIAICYLLNVICYLTTPFVGAYGHSHLQFSIAARNILEKKTLIPFVWPGQTYLNHPPLLYWALAIGYKLFGFSDFIGRLIPFLFSLGSAIFFYKLIKKYFNVQTAKYSLFFYLTFPMFLFYGAFIQFEPLVLFFSLGSFYFLDKYLGLPRHSERSEESRWGSFVSLRMTSLKIIVLLLTVICLLLSALSDFSGLIFAGLLIIYLIIKKRWFIALLLLLSVICYLLIYFNFLSNAGFSIQNLLIAYTNRAGTNIFSINFILRFIGIIFVRLFLYFSPLFIMIPLLTPKFLACSCLHPNRFANRCGRVRQQPMAGRKLSPPKKMIIILFLVFPLLNILSLPSGSATHPYFIFFFIPIIALVLGIFITNKKLRKIIIIAQILWSLTIFSLKIYQIRKFSWQYAIAVKTAKIIGKNTTFYKNWALDKELFYWYNKNLSIEIYPEKLLALKNYQADYYLFVCFPQCHNSDHQFLKNLSKKFTWQEIKTEVPTYIFNLNQIRKPKDKKQNLILLKDKLTYGNKMGIIEEIKKIFRIKQQSQ